MKKKTVMVYVVTKKGVGSAIPVCVTLKRDKAVREWNKIRKELKYHYIAECKKWEKAHTGTKNETYRGCVKKLSVKDPDKLNNYPYCEPGLEKVPLIR